MEEKDKQDWRDALKDSPDLVRKLTESELTIEKIKKAKKILDKAGD